MRLGLLLVGICILLMSAGLSDPGLKQQAGAGIGAVLLLVSLLMYAVNRRRRRRRYR